MAGLFLVRQKACPVLFSRFIRVASDDVHLQLYFFAGAVEKLKTVFQYHDFFACAGTQIGV
jgi:hypothetical protein